MPTNWKPQPDDFRPFYLEDNLTSTCTACLLGKRGSGKTTILRAICRHLYDHGYCDGTRPDCVIGFSDSEDFNSNLGEFVPEAMIYSDISDATLTKICNMQKAFQQEFHRTQNILVLSDDTGFDTKAFRKKMYKKIIQNGRHMNICIFQVLQDCKAIPPGIRSNIDFCFSCYTPNAEERERLRKGFFGVFKTQWLFDDVFAMLTENRTAIVAKNFNVASHKLSDQIFHFHAPKEVEPCRLGRKLYWEMSDYCRINQNMASLKGLLNVGQQQIRNKSSSKKGHGGGGKNTVIEDSSKNVGQATNDEGQPLYRKITVEQDKKYKKRAVITHKKKKQDEYTDTDEDEYEDEDYKYDSHKSSLSHHRSSSSHHLTDRQRERRRRAKERERVRSRSRSRSRAHRQKRKTSGPETPQPKMRSRSGRARVLLTP